MDYKLVFLHSSLGKTGRMAAVNKIKKANIVITSDLLARGIDELVDVVIQWEAPFKDE